MENEFFTVSDYNPVDDSTQTYRHTTNPRFNSNDLQNVQASTIYSDSTDDYDERDDRRVIVEEENEESQPGTEVETRQEQNREYHEPRFVDAQNHNPKKHLQTQHNNKNKHSHKPTTSNNRHRHAHPQPLPLENKHHHQKPHIEPQMVDENNNDDDSREVDEDLEPMSKSTISQDEQEVDKEQIEGATKSHQDKIQQDGNDGSSASQVSGADLASATLFTVPRYDDVNKYRDSIAHWIFDQYVKIKEWRCCWSWT